jgi:cation-transporting P-type ATPase E
MAKSSSSQTEEFKQLLEDQNQDKRQKGPKTIIKDDMVKMKGDPLGLHVSLNDEKEDVFDVKNKLRSKDDIVVERYNPEVKEGLTTEEVELRTMAGLQTLAIQVVVKASQPSSHPTS